MDSSLRLTVQNHETAQVKHQQIDSLRLMPIFISLRLKAEATFSIVFENIAPRTVISIGIASSLGAIYSLKNKENPKIMYEFISDYTLSV